MRANARDVIDHGLPRVLDGQPLDILAGARAGAFAHVAKPLGRQLRGFQTRSEQAPDDVVGEEFHAAIGVMDDKELTKNSRVPSSL